MKNSFSVLFFVLLTCVLISPAFAVESVNIGDMKIFSLLDGRSESDPKKLLIGATDEQIQKYIPDGKVKNQILAFLIEVPGKKILFDTGLGESKHGKIMSVLKELGISPDEIDTIFLTHLHPDHVGGLTNIEGEAAFPNAEVFVSRIERDWWLNDKKDEDVKKALALYEEKGKLNIFEWGETLTNFITAIDTSGHTPGHTAFHVKREHGEILIIGDTVHCAEIILPVPEVAVVYDVDPAKAPKARKFILDMAAENNIPVAGMHLPVPGFWKIQKDGDGYKKSSIK